MNRRAFLSTASALPLAGMQAEDSGFTSLFDGRTLQGWSVQEGPESAFYVKEGAIVVHEGSGFPTWLRSDKQYENFDFRGEFFIRGWMDSGIYLHAPEHGRPIWCGMDFHIFHNNEEKPATNSMGAILPVVPPLKINVKNKGEWNTFRILMDWPRLRAWTNDETVLDVDVESLPELRHRLRRGYLGLQSLSYPIRFRSLRVRELPSKAAWQPLFVMASDVDKWAVSEGKPNFQALDDILRGDGVGHFGTKENFRDFELQMYIRHAWHHNGGVLFRSGRQGTRGRNYEIQLHDVEGAHFPTGSLYHLKRSIYPRIEAGQWFLFQLYVKDRYCLVRVNGDTVMEYDKLDNLEEGAIELQAHDMGKFTEYKQILVRRI